MTSITSLHAAHVENMKKRFEEAKERINAMHQRAVGGTANFPSFLNSNGANGASNGTNGNGGDFPGADELDFFSRIRSRPQRPLIAPPHPELTPQQKQHIVDLNSAQNQAPPKRFGGSVAERVMIFERCPINVNQSNQTSESKEQVVNNKNSNFMNEKRPMINNSMPSMPMPALINSHNQQQQAVVVNNVPSSNQSVTLNNSAAPWKSLQQEGLGRAQPIQVSFIQDFFKIHIVLHSGRNC